MKLRHLFLVFSLAASAASSAFANYQSVNHIDAPDVESTRTLAKGSFASVDDVDAPAEKFSVKLRKGKNTEFNNATLGKKYSSSSMSASGNIYSWLKVHPITAGRVSSQFGSRVMDGRVENHPGLDFSAPSGTPIYATGPGLVTKAGWGNGYGQYVEIDHGNGYLTRYAHASRIGVHVGDNVKAGEVIANVGCTGRCTGPHLHYEVVKDGKRQNPSTYLAMLP